MLSMSETRDICSRLFASSLLELQEVPKSADRNPQRTFFLWHVNLSKAYAWLLDHLYKSLARLGQRRAHERARQAPLLAKCSRTDVKEDVAGLLSEWEKEQLERLNETLRALTIAEMRTERDVFIVRDLPG